MRPRRPGPPGAADPDEVARVFAEAFERPTDERAAFVEAACREAPALRAEVEALLAAAEAAGGFLATTDREAAAGLVADLPPEPAPARVGPYRVLRELGRGGMGVVYLAERAEGGFEQRVALKLLRGDAASRGVHRRFLAERQILARLEHPSVARLIDGGVSAEGRPFFALEYVDGEPITSWCDSRRLGVEARLRLFVEVCRAVQYAHANLVLHRDLKPSNVLVTSDGTPKLLDFGVAKLLGEAAAAAGAPPTVGPAPALTPEYAAPEQLLGGAVTTATDVFALGVVLCELLTGRRPYQVRRGPFGTVVTPPRDAAPELPSALAASGPASPGRDPAWAEEVAHARGTTADKLRRRLAGDLDAIVLRAAQPEAGRRYGSPEALAADLGRHLEGQPVLARRATLRYRAAKFVRRHRAPVAASLAAAAALVAGLGATLWQAERAEREASRARAVQRFLVGVFEGADPTRSLGEALTARQVLDQAADRLRRTGQLEPATRAELADTLARTYRSLGLLDTGQHWSHEAVAGFRATLGASHPRTALAELTETEIRADRGDVAGARAALDALVPRLRAGFGADSLEDLRARSARAALLGHTGELEAALTEQREILSASARLFAGDPLTVAERQGDVAGALADLSRLGEAEAMFRDALATLERAGARHSPQGARLESALADLLDLAGRDEEAGALFQKALETGRAVLGPRHPQVAQTLLKYGVFLVERRRHREAQAALEQAIAILEPLGHYDLGAALRYLGFEHLACERLIEAREAFARAERFLRAKLGDDHPLVWAAVVTTAYADARLGRVAEGERRLREALPALARLHGPESKELRMPRKYLGEVLRLAGRPAEAALEHRQVLALERRLFGSDENLSVAVSKHQLALDLLAGGRAGDRDEARRLVDEALAFLRRREPEPARLGEVLTTSGRLSAVLGETARARSELREAAGLLSQARGEQAPSTRAARAALVALDGAAR